MKKFLVFLLICAPFLGDAAPLPVQFYSFEVKLENGDIHLQWSTISETSNMHFAIERSSDGEYWEPIGNINGSVNSSTLIEYSFIDPSPENFAFQYRIKQVDFTGFFQYSHIARVRKYEEAFLAIKSFPNPANSFINVETEELPDGAQLEILNSLGQVLRSIQITVKGTQQIDLDGLAKGYYYLSLNSETEKVVERFFKH